MNYEDNINDVYLSLIFEKKNNMRELLTSSKIKFSIEDEASKEIKTTMKTSGFSGAIKNAKNFKSLKSVLEKYLKESDAFSDNVNDEEEKNKDEENTDDNENADENKKQENDKKPKSNNKK